MNESMWEKINTIYKVHGHNTTNESPISAPPTVSVIVVNQQQIRGMNQNNANFGFPNMGFNSPMLNMYQQEHNYNLLAAAAQSFMSASNYNHHPMYSQPFTPMHHHQYQHPSSSNTIVYNNMLPPPFVHSPQMMQRPTSTPIQQQQHYPPPPPPPPPSNFIKRKPVRSTERHTMSPQIQQRLSRRKSAPAVVEKKKVRFKDEPTIHYIDSVESDDDEYRSWKSEDRRIRKFSHHGDWEEDPLY